VYFELWLDELRENALKGFMTTPKARRPAGASSVARMGGQKKRKEGWLAGCSPSRKKRRTRRRSRPQPAQHGTPKRPSPGSLRRVDLAEPGNRGKKGKELRGAASADQQKKRNAAWQCQQLAQEGVPRPPKKEAVAVIESIAL